MMCVLPTAGTDGVQVVRLPAAGLVLRPIYQSVGGPLGLGRRHGFAFYNRDLVADSTVGTDRQILARKRGFLSGLQALNVSIRHGFWFPLNG